ncbi:MAG: PAS domain S-box protein [Chloroflexales bacterium]
MPFPHPSRAQLARENWALRARLAKAEQALADQYQSEQERVEEQVAAATRQSQAILEKLAAGVLLINAEGRCTFANTRAAAMFGLTPDTLVGKSPADVLPPEVAQIYLERNRHIIATNAAEEYEATFTLPIGERTFFIVDQVLTDAQGAGYAMLTSSIDVTARVRAEAALRESEAKLRVLFEMLPVGVSILDAAQRIVFVNPALERILDIEHAVLMQGGYRTRRYLRPDGTPMPTEAFASRRVITEQRAIHDVETGIVKEDGTVIWTSVSAVPVAFQDWYVIVVTTDITERKRTEDALRTNRQNLESLIENTDGSIWSVDAQYRLIVGNRLYHHNTRAALGRSMTSGECVLTPALPQAALDEWQAYYDQAMRQEPFSIEASTRFTATPHTVEYRLSPITSATGQVMGVTVFGRDITARKHTEDALQQAMAALTQANTDLERQTHELQASAAHLRSLLHEKEVLLKEIHHRVKNNLQVVMSLLRLQSRQVTGAQAVAALRDSRQRVEVIALAHELLYRTDDLAMIDAAQYLQLLSSQIIQIYAPTPDQITLSIRVEAISLSLDHAVPCGLIVSELLTNSLKYAFPNGQRGEVGVMLCATSPDRLTLTVWDTGVGLDPNADAARPPSLGMSLVHDLARQLHGTAVIASIPGVTVTISFPRGAASV